MILGDLIPELLKLQRSRYVPAFPQKGNHLPVDPDGTLTRGKEMVNEGPEAPLVGKVVEHDFGEKRVGVQPDVTSHLLRATLLEGRSMGRRGDDHGSPGAAQIEKRCDLLHENVVGVVERDGMLEAACP